MSFESEPELDLQNNIVRPFNDHFGSTDWKDADKIRDVIAEEIPAKVSADKAYQNAMRNSDRQNTRIEHDRALERVLIELLPDHTELFKQFQDNPSFKKWLCHSMFTVTYEKPPGPLVCRSRWPERCSALSAKTFPLCYVRL